MTARNKNILMSILIVLPFIATFAFVRTFVDLNSMDKVNKGSLILPHVQLADLNLTNQEKAPFTSSETADHWWLVYVADGSCSSECKNGLFYLMKQLHVALGKKSPRVARLVIHTDTPSPELTDFLANNATGTLELSSSKKTIESAFSSVFPGELSPLNKIFIMSPDGQIILWYDSPKEQNDVLLEADKILADLKRMLKGA